MSFNRYSKSRRSRKPYRKGKRYRKSSYSLFKPKTWPKDAIGMRWPWNAKKVSNIAMGLAKKALFNTNAEFKRIEYGQVDQAPTSTPVITNLFALTQGTTATTRIGDHIKATDFTLKGTIRASTGMSETSAFRLMLVQQKHNEADANPVIGDILQSTTTYSFRSIPKSKNFKILFDKTYTVNSNKPYRDLFIRWKGQLPIKYNADVSTTKPVGNGLFLIWFTNQTTNLPVLDYYYRGHYIDN